MTESLEAGAQNDGLIRVQRETLDNLAEAVAVFGSNGRAQLFNPAFAKMWKLSAEALQQQPHIEIRQWRRAFTDPRSLSPARPRAFYTGMRVTF